jgi:hypothetical protein
MCLRNIALKKNITNLLADKLITIMVFVQFCDIKNVANFSHKLAKIDDFILFLKSQFLTIFLLEKLQNLSIKRNTDY